MKFKISSFSASIYSALVFAYSLYLLPLLVNGDQKAYRYFYDYCFYNNSITQQFLCYRSSLGTQEPIYFFIIKYASLFFSKDVFISISNAIITFLLVKLIFKYYKKTKLIHIFILLVLSNYYFTVLLFSAERLKFAFLFLLLSFSFSSNKTSLLLRTVMIFTHLQTVLIQVSLLIKEVFSENTSIPPRKQFFYKTTVIVGSIVTMLILYVLLQEQISRKFIGYSDSASETDLGILGFMKASIFIAFTYISTKKTLPVMMQLPLLIAAAILGPSRIIIMILILYTSTIIVYKKKADFILTICLVYFSFQTIDFIKNVYKYGTGFIPN